MDLADFLTDRGYDVIPIFDGVLKRFEGHSKKSKSGWYVGFADEHGKYLVIGDWVFGTSETWYSIKKLKSNQFVKDKIEKAKLEQINLKIETQNKVAAESENYYQRNQVKIGLESFPYCRRKKISHIGSAEFCEDRFGVNLCVPIKDATGRIWSVQKIYEDGEKMFMPGGKVKGCFFTFGELENGAKIYLCEGFATGASIYESTGVCTVVAFYASNLSAVCSALVEKYPVSEIIIAADNDQFNKKENVGVKAAQDCQIKYNLKFVYPKFNDGLKDHRPTDYNDLFCLSGKDECKKQLVVSSDLAIQKTDEYIAYKNLFELLYPTAKKCLLTGQVTYQNGSDRKSILNEIKVIRANAKMAGMPKDNVEDFLETWMHELKPQMLVDLPEYDNFDYIGQVLEFVEVENIEHKYFVDLMKHWFSGIFARLYNNHYQNKMVIFGGDQGLGKDTFIESLFKDFKPYFTSAGINEKENENYQTMGQRLVLNISEFDRTSRLHVAHLKNIITANEATFRPPYAREPATIKFRTSFISSCNVDDIFRDETGNRRYMFFKLRRIDWKYPKDISLKILSQAHHLYLSEYIPPAEAVNAMDLIIGAMTPDQWEDSAAELWNARIDELAKLTGKDRFRFVDIALLPVEISKIIGIKPKAVASFIKKRFQFKSDNVRYYTSDSVRSSLLEPKDRNNGIGTSIKNFAVPD